jgi:hypothetical protein
VGVLVTVGLIVLVLWLLRGSPTGRLREQYLRRVGLPRALAEESLARQLARVRERYPGRSEAWYLRYLLTELRRDRR